MAEVPRRPGILGGGQGDGHDDGKGLTTMLPAGLLGPAWRRDGFRQPGWLLMPLRLFLGVTFLYASLQKFANPAYLSSRDPGSVAAQMRSLRHQSPIGPLLGLSLHAPALVGLLIAFGELAVAVAVLLGLFTRLAAVGGMALALTFFLTVSWNTSPYYYGSDIVFFFAWTVLAGFGDGGVMSVGALIAGRVRRNAGAPPASVPVVLPPATMRRLCEGTRHHCGIRADGTCASIRDCPLQPDARRPAADDPDLDRRAVLVSARWAAVVAAAAAVGAGLTAAVGRLVGGTATASGSLPGSSPSATPTSSHRRHTRPTADSSGVTIAKTSQLPVGQAGRFTDPATGEPAYLVHPSGDTFVAFSAVCTHAGCLVNFDSSSLQFVCPCHGGTYSATNGQVLAGPPPAPLHSIPVRVSGGEISVT